MLKISNQYTSYIARCLQYLKLALYDSRQFITPIALLFSIGIPITYIFYANTDNIWLDTLCVGISIATLCCQFNVLLNRKYLPIIWLSFLIINFPIMFIYNLLSNPDVVPYKLSMMIMLLVIFSIITNLALLILVLCIGTLGAYLIFSLEATKWFIPIHIRHELPIYIVGIVFGLIISFRKEKKYQKRLEIARLCIRQINHELRTPLTKIQWNARNIVNLIPENRRKALSIEQEINNEITHSTEIIKVLSVMASTLDEEFIDYQKISMYECIEEAITRYPYNDMFDIEKICWQDSEDFYFKGSKLLMVQVIFNLLKNSIVALKGLSKQAIEIYNISDKKYHYLLVKDTGIGIKKNNQKRIFQPLFTTREEGTGLGLYFCQEIVKKFRGNIYCQSEWKVGTTFTIKLPKHQYAEKYSLQ